MRTFKIGRRFHGTKPKDKLARKELGIAKQQGTLKARLKRSGLWDESAAHQSTLVVTRIIRPQCQ